MVEKAAVAPRRMDWLDYGRLVGALWVMFDHYCFTGVTPMISPGITGYGVLSIFASYGMIGLYFFFMTSGLVITLTAQKHSASEFFTRRLVRVYPTFLFCMTVTALICLWGPDKFHVTPMQYLANLTINPLSLGYRPVDAVYWTLTVEIAFYCCFLAVIMTGQIKRLQTVIAIWVGLQFLSALAQINVPILSQYFYFLAVGAVIAMIYQRRNLRLNYALLAALLALCLRSGRAYALTMHIHPLPLFVGIVGLFVLFLALRKKDVRLPYARRIGSVTYPLYLLHFHIGLSVIYWFGNSANQWLLMPALVIAMLLVSAIVDDLIEFRLRAFWLRLVRATVARPFAWWDGRVGRAGTIATQLK
jgi:peptidoglycan/LPS O-acetylase OafA/YrhL